MSEIVPIKVKWLKNKYDVNVMLDESAEVLKAQVPVKAIESRLASRLGRIYSF